MADIRKFTDEDIEAALVQAGGSNHAAAKLLGCCSATISNYRNRSGNVRIAPSGRPWRLTAAQKEEIAQLRESGLPFSAIAKEIGCSVSATQWTCSVLGVEHPTRPYIVPPRDPNRISMRNGRPMRFFGPAEDAAVVEMSMAGGTPRAIGKVLQRAPSSVLNRLRVLARREEREFA